MHTLIRTRPPQELLARQARAFDFASRIPSTPERKRSASTAAYPRPAKGVRDGGRTPQNRWPRVRK